MFDHLVCKSVNYQRVEDMSLCHEMAFLTQLISRAFIPARVRGLEASDDTEILPLLLYLLWTKFARLFRTKFFHVSVHFSVLQIAAIFYFRVCSD